MNLGDTVDLVAGVCDQWRVRLLNSRFSRNPICHHLETVFDRPTYIHRVWLDHSSYREYSVNDRHFERFQVRDGMVHGVCMAMGKHHISSDLVTMFGNHELTVPSSGGFRLRMIVGRLIRDVPGVDNTDDDIQAKWDAETHHKLAKTVVMAIDCGVVQWVVGEFTDGSRIVLPLSKARGFNTPIADPAVPTNPLKWLARVI